MNGKTNWRTRNPNLPRHLMWLGAGAFEPIAPVTGPHEKLMPGRPTRRPASQATDFPDIVYLEVVSDDG